MTHSLGPCGVGGRSPVGSGAEALWGRGPKPCGVGALWGRGPKPCGVGALWGRGPKPCGVGALWGRGPKPCGHSLHYSVAAGGRSQTPLLIRAGAHMAEQKESVAAVDCGSGG
ncbi:hypothetical protein CgunFtcFv8_024222 [Champsocephalus gunnari]|uniref:Uncharacterized protein n=1 Tax=Champsocephalus gunnari TaxID=52237 RepID=A0AAN8HQI9_CHAGU|nr:hypothetical protein CgunFtcFv8_024222 [Champsocephalus gunnari]